MKHHTHERGAAVITAVLFFVFISTFFAIALSSPVVREYTVARDFDESKGSFYLAEAGHEDALYRIRNAKQIGASETLTLNGNTVVTTITTSGNNKDVLSSGSISNNVRKVSSSLTSSPGASFSFGVQTGNGGFEMENSASVTGNVYANGVVAGSGSNVVSGSVVSAGSTGNVTGISSGGSMYAHTIANSTVGGDAYYQTKTSTSVSGASHPGSADQPPIDLPISDTTVAQFEADALAGGTYASPCTISSATTWSARKVTCSTLVIKDKLTLTGMVWVTGNVEISNNGKIVLDPSLGSQSAGVIADNPNDQIGSSMIDIKNSPTFSGSGTQGSYVMLLSQNNSAETGGSNKAISLENSATGALLLYAAHGEISIQNNTALKEVTAYRVHLQNSANVTYESGLANTLFVSGPGGSWTINDWKESQ